MKILSLILAFTLMSLSAAAQSLVNRESLKITPENSSYVARIIPNRQFAACGQDADLKAVTITILDKKTGKRIVDGKKEDLRLSENNIERKIVSLSPLDSLINVYMLVDVSFSLGTRFEELSKAANAFIANLRPNDRLSAIAFDGRISELHKLTNVSEIPKKKGMLKTGTPGTSIYDVVDLVVNKKITKSPDRNIIILFTDGVDTTSSKKAKDNYRDVQETEATIYALQYSFTKFYEPYYSQTKAIMNSQTKNLPYNVKMGIKKIQEVDKKQEFANNYLQELTRLTGGNVYPAENTENLNQAFSSILEEVRSQYVLCYSSLPAN